MFPDRSSFATPLSYILQTVKLVNFTFYRYFISRFPISPGATDRRFHPIFIKSFYPLKMLQRPVTTKIGLSAAPTWGRLGPRVAQLPHFGTFILPHSVSKLKFSNNILISPMNKNIVNLT